MSKPYARIPSNLDAQGRLYPSTYSTPKAPILRNSSSLSLTSKTPSVVVTPPDVQDPAGPKIFGLPLKYVSLVTLALQNAALAIVMHYSRVSTPADLAYSPASAVLLNELLKGSISFYVALLNSPSMIDIEWSRLSLPDAAEAFFNCSGSAIKQVCFEIFSSDCWKLSIPALLYVVQNSLQFVAVANLPVASFQVSYQMKILTTAAFSVALLRKKLTPAKWTALLFLAVGVAIVQLQTSSTARSEAAPVGSAYDSAPLHIHVMSPVKGFSAVIAACFTSGLAGVYFEMVLKNSKTDLWIRNVQLSLFSLVPALIPILYATPPPDSRGFFLDIFRHFGFWAWATVLIQVFGGLVTAIVIKYSDNILKGFATSLSIIISFLASVYLFDFKISSSFVTGASIVLIATWMYNQPPGKEMTALSNVISGQPNFTSRAAFSPVTASDPILGETDPYSSSSSRRSSPYSSPRVKASALGNAFSGGALEDEKLGMDTFATSRYTNAPYGSPFPSRPPSRDPSRSTTPS